MLLTALLIALQAKPEAGEAQAWEKLIAPGVTYRMEVDPVTPLLINAVRISPSAEGLSLVGELAGGRVYEDGSDTQGRETVTQTALRTRSLVAVNADFFPFTGDPLGAMVIGGELVSVPQPGRAAFCWGKGFAQVAYLSFSASFSFEGQSYPIVGLNQECADDTIVLNTPRAGLALSKEPATHIVLALPDKITPVGSWKPVVARRVDSAKSVPVNDGEMVLTFRGAQAEKLQFLNAGDTLDLQVSCTGVDWQRASDAVAGGPFLVKDGKAFDPFAAEGFTSGFGKDRHPRSAIGRTAAGDLWIVTVDGRQTMSAGATIDEMAQVMLRFGCVEAINLDGGGSTTLNIEGLTVNRPSEGSERAVASALLVMRAGEAVPAAPDGEPGPVIAGPSKVKAGTAAKYRLVEGTGADLPASQVLWSAQGAAWIDQGGVLHGVSEGTCLVRACFNGRTASVTVAVEKN